MTAGVMEVVHHLFHKYCSGQIINVGIASDTQIPEIEQIKRVIADLMFCDRANEFKWKLEQKERLLKCSAILNTFCAWITDCDSM